MKFSAFNVDFDCPSLDFLGSRKPAHEGIKEQYPCKSLYLRLQMAWLCCLSQQALVMSFLAVSTSMTLKDPELPR